MKNLFLFIVILFAAFICSNGITKSQEDEFAICKERQASCKADCEAGSIRPLKRSKCMKTCESKFHECRELKLIEDSKSKNLRDKATDRIEDRSNINKENKPSNEPEKNKETAK